MEHLIMLLKTKTATNFLIGTSGGIIAFLLQEQRGWKMLLKTVAISIFSATVLAPAIIEIFAKGFLGVEHISELLDRSVTGIIAISADRLLPVLRNKLIKEIKNEKEND